MNEFYRVYNPTHGWGCIPNSDYDKNFPTYMTPEEIDDYKAQVAVQSKAIREERATNAKKRREEEEAESESDRQREWFLSIYYPQKWINNLLEYYDAVS